MTRVDFYVVSAQDEDARFVVTIRLADKAFRRGHRLFVHTASESHARHLDTLMWTWRPSNFLPHALVGEPGSQRIAIGWGQEPADHDDVLINLAGAAPAFFSRFHRVAEIVTQHPEHLAAQRQAWRFYKDRGYPLAKHDL